MKNLFFLLSLALILGAAKCKEEADLFFTLGDTFKLKLGEAGACTCKAVGIQFTAVTEDSRCPKNTNCVWAGEIKTSMIINGTTYELKLGGDSKPAPPVEVEGYSVQLLEVNPYPVAGEKIDPASYVAKLIVKEK